MGKIWSGSLDPATWGLRLPSWGDFGALTARNKVSALGLILCRVSITGLGLSATPDRPGTHHSLTTWWGPPLNFFGPGAYAVYARENLPTNTNPQETMEQLISLRYSDSI